MNENRLTVNIKEKLSFNYVKRFLLLSVILASAVVVNQYYHKDFMRESIELSIFLQKGNLEIIAVIFSAFVTPLAMASLPINAFLSSDKLKSFRLLFGLMICVWLHAILKMIYMDQRPSFLSKELKEGPQFCEKEFGMPSGHSFFAAYITCCICNYYNRKFQQIPLRLKALIYGSFIIIAILIVFSRLYLGVHSFNQVVIGLLLGTCVFSLINTTKEHITYLILMPTFKVKKNYPTEKRIAILLCILFVIVGSLFFVFFQRYESDPSKTDFYSQIINCERVKNDFNLGFNTKVLQDGLFSTFVVGLLIGIAMAPKACIENFSFNYDHNFRNIILRMGCVLLINLPLIVLLLIKFQHPGLEIGKTLLFYPLFGFLTGRYVLDLIEFLGIPLDKRNPLEIAFRNNDGEHI